MPLTASRVALYLCAGKLLSAFQAQNAQAQKSIGRLGLPPEGRRLAPLTEGPSFSLYIALSGYGQTHDKLSSKWLDFIIMVKPLKSEELQSILADYPRKEEVND